jgi:hypothetical protein
MEIDSRQSLEPRLPKAELGQRASQHIKDYMQAVKNTPESLQELPDQFFSRMTAIEGLFEVWQTSNPTENEFSYKRNGRNFRVEYDSTNKVRSLYVLKEYSESEAPQNENDALLREVVSIDVNQKNHPDYGRISHKTVYKDGRIELHIDTPTASQRIKDFRTTNFSQPQTQPQK